MKTYQNNTCYLCIGVLFYALFAIHGTIHAQSNITNTLKINATNDRIGSFTAASALFGSATSTLNSNAADVFVVTCNLKNTGLNTTGDKDIVVLSYKLSATSTTWTLFFKITYNKDQGGWIIKRRVVKPNSTTVNWLDYKIYDQIGNATGTYTFVIGKDFTAIGFDSGTNYKLATVFYGMGTNLYLGDAFNVFNAFFRTTSTYTQKRVTVNQPGITSSWKAFRMEGSQTDLVSADYPLYSQKRLIKRLNDNSANQANPYRIRAEAVQETEVVAAIDDSMTSNTSETEEVSIKNFHELFVSPNPSSNLFNVDFSLVTDEKVSFRLLQSTGFEVYRQENLPFYKGTNRYVIKIPERLPNGVYLLHVISSSGQLKAVHVVVQ